VRGDAVRTPIFTSRDVGLPDGWRGRLIAAAPWLPVLAGLTLLGLLTIVVTSVGNALFRNQMLLVVGVVPAWVKELTWGILPFMLALTLMTAAMALLWRHRARSRVGRLYYTLVVLTGWYVCFVLLRTGPLGG
jgi:hypothetical protein